jgi:hypothetical protein
MTETLLVLGKNDSIQPKLTGAMNQCLKLTIELTILLVSRHDWDPRFWDELRSRDLLVKTKLQSWTQGQDVDSAYYSLVWGGSKLSVRYFFQFVLFETK